MVYNSQIYRHKEKEWYNNLKSPSYIYCLGPHPGRFNVAEWFLIIGLTISISAMVYCRMTWFYLFNLDPLLTCDY